MHTTGEMKIREVQEINVIRIVRPLPPPVHLTHLSDSLLDLGGVANLGISSVDGFYFFS
jgi:hypothetical protein